MPSASAIRAGRAFVELFTDDRKLVRGLRAAQRKVQAFGKSIRNIGLKLAGLGTLIIAPLAAAAKAFAGYGDQIAKMAKRTGFSVESLSELQFVASQTGTSLEALEGGLRRMQRSIYDAGRGLSTQVDALADLGLTFEDLDGLAPDEQFKRLADAIAGVEDPTRKAALAQALFGRAGTQLLPMFAEGAAGIDRLQREARRLGLTMSGEDARAAEDFTDALDKLWKTIRIGIVRVGAALAPVLQQVAEHITTVVVRIGQWIQRNHEIIVNVLKVAAVITGIGAALVVLGAIISGVGSAIGVLIGIVAAAITVLKLMGAVLLALISPIGLVIGAVAAMAGYLVYATGAGGKALAWLGEKFTALKDGALKTFRGIADALVAGDIALAAQVLWASLKLAWLEGTHGLRQTWEAFQTGLVGLFIDLTATLRRVWTEFLRLWRSATETTANWIAKRLLELRGLFDDSLDVEYAKKQTDRMTQAAIANIEREAKQRRNAIEDERQQRQKLNQQQFEANLRSQQEAVEAARRAWQDALEESRNRREQKERAAPGEGPGELKDPADVINQLEYEIENLDIGLELEEQAAKIGVRGTFNAAAIRGLLSAPGNAADRTAKATEDTARNTKKILQNTRTANLAFA